MSALDQKQTIVSCLDLAQAINANVNPIFLFIVEGDFTSS
jgi:hypothetical protein